MTVDELQQLLDGYPGDWEVQIAVDNKQGGVDTLLSIEQEVNLTEGIVGLFATE